MTLEGRKPLTFRRFFEEKIYEDRSAKMRDLADERWMQWQTGVIQRGSTNFEWDSAGDRICGVCGARCSVISYCGVPECRKELCVLYNAWLRNTNLDGLRWLEWAKAKKVSFHTNGFKQSHCAVGFADFMGRLFERRANVQAYHHRRAPSGN